jgi:hypothetical protein
MDEIISYKMCAVKVRNAKLRNSLMTFLKMSVQMSTRIALCPHVSLNDLVVASLHVIDVKIS